MGAFCPFTVQVGRFNTSLSNLGDLARLNVTLRDVSFLLRSQGSLPTPRGVALLRGGWNFLRRMERPEAVHRLTDPSYLGSV